MTMEAYLKFLDKYLGLLLQGTVTTVELTTLSVLGGVVLGLLAALGRLSRAPYFRLPAQFYVWVIRGTPLLVQIFLFHFGLPQLIPGFRPVPFVSAITALSINSGAYIAEIIRAGILSIDKGQMEAAKSLGMTYSQAMRRVILPQTYRRLLPPLGNEFIALLKDSSLVSTIAMTDLMRHGQQIYSTTFRPFDTLLTVAILYLFLTTIISVIVERLERRLGVSGV